MRFCVFAFAAVLLAASMLPAEARRGGLVEISGAAYKVPNIPWCGWYMMKLQGVTDRAYWRARHWLNYGSDAGGPCVGCIAVWRHHVGKIVGRTKRGWQVLSGNDGNRVRTRETSLRGAIGFRRP